MAAKQYTGGDGHRGGIRQLSVNKAAGCSMDGSLGGVDARAYRWDRELEP